MVQHKFDIVSKTWRMGVVQNENEVLGVYSRWVYQITSGLESTDIVTIDLVSAQLWPVIIP